MGDFSTGLQQAAGDLWVKRKEPMSLHTTFRVGGEADYYLEPETPEQFQRVLQFCHQEKMPCLVMGRGSNLLVGDGGYSGVVLHLGDKMSSCHIEGKRIVAQAGISLASLARQACTAGLSGMEFAAGIPGSLGGAITMNAGAYGGEMKNVVAAVELLLPDGAIRWITGEEMDFSYRSSRVGQEGSYVLAAEILLEEEEPAKIRKTMEELATRRREKQPLEYASAGSTFKRPEGYFAGKLIEDAGLKGYAVGDACVSTKHAGFVINRGKASAADILSVCRHVKNTVEEKFGVVLEMEVKMVGDF